MPPLVIAGDALARGIMSNFVDTYAVRREHIAERMKGVVELGVSTDILVPRFGYPESAPMPSYSPWGEPGKSRSFRYRTFDGYNWRFTTNVRWLRYQRTMNQLDDIYKNAARCQERWLDQDDLIITDILRETASVGGLPITLTAADGVGIFSATDGDGAARFGVTGGNTVAGHVFTSPIGLQDAVFAGISRAQSFLDTQSQPLHPRITDVTIFIPPAFRQNAVIAFDGAFSPTGTSTSTSQSAISNPFQSGDLRYTVIADSRFTETTRIVIAINDYDEAPIKQTVVLAPEETFYDKANSYTHGRAGLEEMMFESWKGFTLGLPLNLVEVTT